MVRPKTPSGSPLYSKLPLEAENIKFLQLLGNRIVFSFLDAGLLTYQIAEVIQAGATYFTALEHLNVFDIGRCKREDTLYTDAVADFANGEGFTGAFAFDLNDITAEHLNTGLIAFDDLIAYGNVVTGAEFGKFPLGQHLVLYKKNRVHDWLFKYLTKIAGQR